MNGFKECVEQKLNQIHAHADAMESKSYTSKAEIDRDMAIGVELASQYIDLLSEIVDYIETEGIS